MKIKPRLNWLWIALVAMVLVSLMWDRFPGAPVAGRFGSLPTQGFRYVSRDLPLNEVELQVYHHAGVVKRLYQVGSQRFVLTAIDGSRNRHAVHDPLYCFRGAGWQVDRKQDLAVPGGSVQWLSLARSGQRKEVVFWFTNGQERYGSAGRAWWMSLWSRLSFGKCGSDAALVLLQPGEADPPAWNDIFAQCPFLFEI